MVFVVDLMIFLISNNNNYDDDIEFSDCTYARFVVAMFRFFFVLKKLRILASVGATPVGDGPLLSSTAVKSTSVSVPSIVITPVIREIIYLFMLCF